MTPENISLAFNDLAAGGSSDKVYHVELANDPAGWKVTIQYGRRGAAPMQQVKCAATPYQKAKKLYDKIVREKLAKGYVKEGAAPAAQITPTGEHIVIKPPELLEEVTNGDHINYVNDPAYWMQDKSDGVSRGVVKSDSGEIIGINKLAKPVPLPAELVAELAQIQLTSFQIDAELVGTKLICRDLVNANGCIGGLPYHQRFVMLAAAIKGLTNVIIVQTWTGEDKAPALDLSRRERREGVVFKLTEALYKPGKSGQHKKYKFIKTLSALAGEPRANGKESVEVFLWDPKSQWIRCGTVSLIGKPMIRQGDIVEVAYLYAYPSKLMVQARLLSVRDDVTPEECTVDQLIMKREDA